MTLDHIVFDIGQVLLYWDPDLIYQDLLPDPCERAEFLANICSPEWNLEQDRGRDWWMAENFLIKQHPEKENLIRAFRKNWIKSVPHAIQGSVNILTQFIEQGRDVTLLTNFNQDTFVEARRKFPFLKQPRGATVSGEVNLVKPDPAIYALHTSTFDLNSEKCLFIDDSLPNVLAARHAGWTALQFTSEENLSIELNELGLL